MMCGTLDLVLPSFSCMQQPTIAWQLQRLLHVPVGIIEPSSICSSGCHRLIRAETYKVSSRRGLHATAVQGSCSITIANACAYVRGCRECQRACAAKSPRTLCPGKNTTCVVRADWPGSH